MDKITKLPVHLLFFKSCTCPGGDAVVTTTSGIRFFLLLSFLLLATFILNLFFLAAACYLSFFFFFFLRALQVKCLSLSFVQVSPSFTIYSSVLFSHVCPCLYPGGLIVFVYIFVFSLFRFHRYVACCCECLRPFVAFIYFY